MPASPSSVLSQGYGAWGSVNLLPTLGFGIGAAAIAIIGIQIPRAAAVLGGGQEGALVLGGGQRAATINTGGAEGVNL